MEICLATRDRNGGEENRTHDCIGYSSTKCLGCPHFRGGFGLGSVRIY